MSTVRYTGTELTSVLDAPPTKILKSNVRVTKRLFKEKYNQKYYDSFGLKIRMHSWLLKK